MQHISRNKMAELQTILSKMQLKDIWVTVMPEFGVRWRDVSQAVRNARLPMTSSNVAKVLCRHVGKHLPGEEIADIVARLRLKLVVTQNRVWHVIRLLEATSDEPVSVLCRTLSSRVSQALRTSKNSNRRPEVQTVNHGDLIYLSVQFMTGDKEGSALYVATPPGEPVALVTSLTKTTLIKACVQGLGYKNYEDAKLYGRDILSLLRVNNRTDENFDDITEIPTYDPIPVVLKNGIDYTYKTYNEQYVEKILGPDPPLLTDLTISKNKHFFDTSRISKCISVNMQLKSEDVGKTLKSWVSKGVLAANSEIVQVFRHIRSNRIQEED